MLDERDIAAVVRLLGNACAQSWSRTEKKRHLMDGLCHLVGADAWVGALAVRMDPGTAPVLAGFQHGGFSEAQFCRFLEIQSHPDIAGLLAPYAEELHRVGGHVTRTVTEIVPLERLMATEVARHCEECGFFPHCFSARPLGGGPVAGVGFYRRPGRPLLGPRESRLVHLVLSENPWLLEHRWPADRGSEDGGLSPRLREVRELLIQGFSRKQIAGNLNISINTVHGYVKELYRHVGVRSHAELLRQFFHGNRAGSHGENA